MYVLTVGVSAPGVLRPVTLAPTQTGATPLARPVEALEEPGIRSWRSTRVLYFLRSFGADPTRIAVPGSPTFTVGGLAVELRRQLGVADIEVMRVGLGFYVNHFDLISGERRR